MRIPFLHRKPEDIASIARRATYVGSAEAATPRLRQRTPEEHARARALFRSWRNGSAPPR
jgi:hypothetical protein